uniref:Uncharacterized protein n=1 Tax=Schistocephalus solidus TaxID=70667 RepID=A0A0X3P5M3_SCHSO
MINASVKTNHNVKRCGPFNLNTSLSLRLKHSGNTIATLTLSLNKIQTSLVTLTLNLIITLNLTLTIILILNVIYLNFGTKPHVLCTVRILMYNLGTHTG